MKNPEGDIPPEQEAGETTHKKVGSSALTSLLSAPQVKMEDFKDVPGINLPMIQNELDSRKIELETSSQYDDRNELSKLFERLFVIGTVTSGWLGDENDEDHGAGIVIGARLASEYDDLCHGIDSFVTIGRRNPSEEKGSGDIFGHYLTDSVTIGFDTTLSERSRSLEDKLKKPFNYPFHYGFTKLTFYEVGDKKCNYGTLPRYVVGLSKGDVKHIERDGRNNDAIFNINTTENLKNRFKILSEIKIENDLFTMALPKNINPYNDTGNAQDLFIVDHYTNVALKHAANSLLKKGPEAIADEDVLERAMLARKEGRLDDMVKIIRDYLILESQEQFKKNKRVEIAARPDNAGKTDGEIDNLLHEAIVKYDMNDPFVQIIRYTERLIEEAKTRPMEEIIDDFLEGKKIQEEEDRLSDSEI